MPKPKFKKGSPIRKGLKAQNKRIFVEETFIPQSIEPVLVLEDEVEQVGMSAFENSPAQSPELIQQLINCIKQI